MSTPELIERFSLQRISRNPAQFDEVKLGWLNGVYIRAMDTDQLTRRAEAFTGREGLEGVVRISAEKIHTLADLMPLAGPLLDGPVDDPKAAEKWLGEDGRASLADSRAALAELDDFSEQSIEQALTAVVERRGAKPRDVYQPLRVALTGRAVSPGIFESAALLGKAEVLAPIRQDLTA